MLLRIFGKPARLPDALAPPKIRHGKSIDDTFFRPPKNAQISPSSITERKCLCLAVFHGGIEIYQLSSSADSNTQVCIWSVVQAQVDCDKLLPKWSLEFSSEVHLSAYSMIKRRSWPKPRAVHQLVPGTCLAKLTTQNFR